jgi:hypothetical protein
MSVAAASAGLRYLERLVLLGVDPADDEELRLQKVTLTLAADRFGEKAHYVVVDAVTNNYMLWRFGTAYRIRTGDLRLERAVS